MQPRGRPRKDGLPAGSVKAGVPTALPAPIVPTVGPGIGPKAPATPGAASAPGSLPPGGASLDPDLLRSTVAAILDTADGFAQRHIESKAVEIGADKATASGFARAAAMSQESRKLVTETVPLVLARHGVSGEHAPEVALLAGLGLYATNLFAVLSKLTALAEESKKRKAACQTPPAASP